MALRVRLIELQNDADAEAAAAAAGLGEARGLGGWAALLPARPSLSGPLPVGRGLRLESGASGQLVVGSLGQLVAAGHALSAAGDVALRSLGEELAARASSVDAAGRGPGLADPPDAARSWTLPRSRLPAGRTLVMGIVNVTPDSFSDGGRFLDAERAVEHGLALAREGADLLDVGGESTSPFGARPVDADEELRRTEPVVRALASRAGVPVSIDTTKAEVAEAALQAGAEVVNDVSGLSRDPRLGPLCARRGAALCLMHLRGTPQDMQSRARYEDLSGEVLTELAEALERARGAGIANERIILDPGLGFAKTAAHNLSLLRRQRELLQLGRPLLVGASRKSFIGRVTGREPRDRLIGSLAAAVAAALGGAAVVRVHDVAQTREALAVADAVRGASP